jgi:mRNA interferase MazF
MERFIAGDIIAINYPFTDLSSFKSRPALIIAKVNENDFIISQITSQKYDEKISIKIIDEDLIKGKLNKESFILPAKLFTSDSKLFKYKIGQLNIEKLDIAIDHVIKILTR